MGTNYIAPTWRMPENNNKDKLSNYSIDFSGSDYIDCGTGLFTDSSISSISISCWVKIPVNNNFTGVIISKDQANSSSHGGTAAKNRNFLLQFSGSGLFWQTSPITSGNDFQNLSVAQNVYDVVDGNWHNIIVTYEAGATSGTAEKKIYIDGAVQATDPQASLNSIYNNTSVPIEIGRRGDGARYYSGEISQVSIFDYALSTDQINYLYNLNNPMAITGAEPVAYWPLGDNSNPTATAGYPNISAGADSVFEFDSSSNSFIQANNVNLDSANKFTVSLWLKVTSDSFEEFFSIYTGSSMNFFIGRRAGNRLDIYFGSFIYQSSVLNTNSFDNIIVVFDGTQASNTDKIKCFVNGNQISLSGSTSNTSLPSGSKIIYLGRRGSTYLDGQLSNVAVWNSDQSSEISNIYNSGVPATTYTNTPTAWYKLNQSANWEADTVGDWQIPDAVSAYPQSFDFDGNDDFVSTNFNVDNYTNLTYSVWVNPTSLNQRGGLASLSSVNNFVTAFWDGSGGRFYVYIGNVLSQITGIWSGSKFGTLGQEKWLHIAVVYDGSGATDADRLKVYADGDYVAFNSLGSIPTSIPSGGGDLIIGKWTTAEYDGKMSNVMLFDSSLPATGTDSVETLYNNGVPLTTAIVTDNLKAWYKLDNNDRFQGDWRNIDYAENLNYTKALSRIGPDNGITSAGNGDRVNCGNNSSLQITGAMSISIWFRVNTISPAHAYNFVMGRARFRTEAAADACWSLLLKGVSYGAPAHFRLQLSDGTTKTIYDITETTNGDFFSDRWQNLIITYDGTTDANSIKAYLNGELHQQFTSSQASINNIAARNLTFYDNDVYQYGDPTYTGALSNCAIWNKKLESSDIASIWNNGSPALTMPSESELQGWWKFSDGTYNSGNTSWSFPDSSQNSNTGETYTFTSSATAFDANSMSDNNVQAGTGISSGMTEQNLVNNNVSALNGESSGMNTTNLVQSDLTRKQPFSNYSIQFDGTDYLDDGTTSGIFNGATSLTISGWMRIKSGSTESIMIGAWQTGSTQFLIRWRNPASNSFEFYLNTGGSTRHADTAGFAISADTWYNVVATWDGSDIRMYLNGVAYPTASATGALNSVSIPNWIGRYSTTYANGQLSNIALWKDTVLTQDDIINIYNNGITQDLNNFRITPTHWYPMDQTKTYYNDSVLVARDAMSAQDFTGVNLIQENIVGIAPGSEANGTGSNLTIADLQGNMYNSDKNAYSINMADYADGVTNPANSGRSTDTP